MEQQQKDHPVEGELPQKPYLHFLWLCFPLFFFFLNGMPPVITTDFRQQSYSTVEQAKMQVEVASILLKWPLLSVGRPFHSSHSAIPPFLRAWARSRYSVYILGGSVCAPKNI